MKTLVVGMGIQGSKRAKFLGAEFAGSVDSHKNADYKNVTDVPLNSYDSALLCVPDGAKLGLMEYMLAHKKNILVEKPILVTPEQAERLESLVKENSVCLYGAYNHRFEPHWMNVKKLLDQKAIGKVYSLRAFYGNGTARDVRNSEWRDQGMGVFSDLAPHLLDMLAYFFGEHRRDFSLVSQHNFENRAADHISMHTTGKLPYVFFEMSLLSWRNTFTLDIVGEEGSIHVNCLCKWGPSVLTVRKRKLPSGRPQESNETLEMNDPTWEVEYAHFKALAGTAHHELDRDIWIGQVLNEVFHDRLRRA